jgi:hypothetical protein
MSLLGMRLESPITLPVGQEIELFVSENELGGSFFAIVETVRLQPKQSVFEVGVSLIEKNFV